MGASIFFKIWCEAPTSWNSQSIDSEVPAAQGLSWGQTLLPALRRPPRI